MKNLNELMDIDKASNMFVTTITHPNAGMPQRVNTKETFIAGLDYGIMLMIKISELNNEDEAMDKLNDLMKQVDILKEKIMKGELTYEP
jgi:hypothetical protein